MSPGRKLMDKDELFRKFPRLETERCELRKVSADHAGDLVGDVHLSL